MTTVYVESPIFTKEDENKYKFVSEEVDEFDEDQDEALRQSKYVENISLVKNSTSVEPPSDVYSIEWSSSF